MEKCYIFSMRIEQHVINIVPATSDEVITIDPHCPYILRRIAQVKIIVQFHTNLIKVLKINITKK